ncbi:MAG: glycosyltransferase family 4 protein [Candidatus Hydrogenedentes bacterium]|nr:glycosyltransferase family 4 protein [Candidatus Hydrogenedentota bacterium]
MRLAFVDLVFCWPPNGGADVDLYETVRRLQDEGHEVHLFVPGLEGSWERGEFNPDDLPFPATRIPFTNRSLHPRNLVARFRQAVDAYRPDAVFVCDGFFLKPYVTLALSHYPCVARYYAYECAYGPTPELCEPDGTPQPSYLREPEPCRRQTVAGLKEHITHWRLNFWAREYLAARAFMPGYYRTVKAAFGNLRAAIVSNDIMAGHLEGLVADIRIFPGGVAVADYPAEPPPSKEANARKVILMTGRAEDPVKGLGVLCQAGERLARTRNDFEIRATLADAPRDADWLKAIGWQPRTRLVDEYRAADICVMPSLWEEPFGLVAVEAMAAARPVCASRVGGLKGIVRDGETGYLVAPGDAAALAERLAALLDDAGLRRAMGVAGRRVAEADYDWTQVVRRHYNPLLEDLAS